MEFWSYKKILISHICFSALKSKLSGEEWEVVGLGMQGKLENIQQWDGPGNQLEMKINIG